MIMRNSDSQYFMKLRHKVWRLVWNSLTECFWLGQVFSIWGDMKSMDKSLQLQILIYFDYLIKSTLFSFGHRCPCLSVYGIVHEQIRKQHEGQFLLPGWVVVLGRRRAPEDPSANNFPVRVLPYLMIQEQERQQWKSSHWVEILLDNTGSYPLFYLTWPYNLWCIKCRWMHLGNFLLREKL